MTTNEKIDRSQNYLPHQHHVARRGITCVSSVHVGCHCLDMLFEGAVEQNLVTLSRPLQLNNEWSLLICNLKLWIEHSAGKYIYFVF